MQRRLTLKFAGLAKEPAWMRLTAPAAPDKGAARWAACAEDGGQAPALQAPDPHLALGARRLARPLPTWALSIALLPQPITHHPEPPEGVPKAAV